MNEINITLDYTNVCRTNTSFLGDFDNCNPAECFAIQRKYRTSVKFIKIKE